jgi:hypothetical protein
MSFVQDSGAEFPANGGPIDRYGARPPQNVPAIYHRDVVVNPQFADAPIDVLLFSFLPEEATNFLDCEALRMGRERLYNSLLNRA